jgi:amino acid adenylation domain-containing protein
MMWSPVDLAAVRRRLGPDTTWQAVALALTAVVLCHSRGCADLVFDVETVDSASERFDLDDVVERSFPGLVKSCELPPGEQKFLVIRSGETVVRWRNDDRDFALAVPAGEQFLAERFFVAAECVSAGELECAAIAVIGTAEAARIQQYADQPGEVPEWRIHERFAVQADLTPDRVAVQFGEQVTTYAELLEQAVGVADRLRARGVAAGEVVGVCAERGLALLPALLGILFADAAYLPLEPEPAQRLEFMAGQAGCRFVLSGHDSLSILGVTVLDLAGGDGPRTAPSGQSRPMEADGGPAYVIYTSGSTGRPKGVLVPHRAIANRLAWMQRQFELTEDDVVLQKTPYGFDVSVWELFWPLLYGARLVMAEPGAHVDPEHLAGLVIRHAVTTIHFVPSMLALFTAEPDFRNCRSLRRIICSGEALWAHQVAAVHDVLETPVYNLYGPTEAAVDVTWWHCRTAEPGPAVPIGTPIDNAVTVILDRSGRRAPLGAVGELHLGGIVLARGYIGEPELTAAAFSTVDGQRLYRTGDLVRFGPQGELHFLGRADRQLKLRGIRIEPGEIEFALRQLEGITDAVVSLRTVAGSPALVAHLVVDSPKDFDRPRVAEIRRQAGLLLPSLTVPQYFVPLSAFPVTPNGKLNHAALPDPTLVRPSRRHTRSPG